MSQDNSMIGNITETSQGLSLNIKKPSNRYIDELLRLNCAPELMDLRLFPNAKEITESFAAFRAVQSYFSDKFSLDDPTVRLYSVADGHRPSTATVFAFRTRWQCYSIDPELNLDHPAFTTVNRLKAFKKRVEELSLHSEKAIIVAVHSHANLKNTVAALKATEKGIVAIPCCVDLSLDVKPTHSYFDWGIHSPKRNVKIWKFY